MKILLSAIALTGLCAISFSQRVKFEKPALELVKRTPVSTLEEKMPRRPFVDWLKELVGPQVEIVWQLSECEKAGELSEQSSDIPACVEANALLPDGRKVVVMVAVGTFKRGITGDPGFYFAVIEKHDQLYSLNRLRDLPEVLRSPEKLREKAETRLVLRETSANPPLPETAISLPGNSVNTSEDPPPPMTPPMPKQEVRRLSEGTLVGSSITMVSPIYPADAKRVNASGEVQVLIVISETGHVIEARAISGHLLLRQAAVTAARQWVFKPTKLNGIPIKGQGVLTFVFERR